MRYTDDRIPTADGVRELLKEDVLEINFTKRDGTKRLMFCTLLPQYLPEKESTSPTHQPSPDVITVWDLEANGWRGIRYDSIESIEHD